MAFSGTGLSIENIDILYQRFKNIVLECGSLFNSII